MSKICNYENHNNEYVNYLKGMPYEELLDETELKIWLSTQETLNNHLESDHHWHLRACYDEIVKRNGNDDAYIEAYEKVMNQWNNY